MSRATQTERVLEYIDEFGSITQLEALRDLGVMRLASRISDIKAVQNRFGEPCYIKRYSLEKPIKVSVRKVVRSCG